MVMKPKETPIIEMTLEDFEGPVTPLEKVDGGYVLDLGDDEMVSWTVPEAREMAKYILNSSTEEEEGWPDGTYATC